MLGVVNSLNSYVILFGSKIVHGITKHIVNNECLIMFKMISSVFLTAPAVCWCLFPVLPETGNVCHFYFLDNLQDVT